MTDGITIALVVTALLNALSGVIAWTAKLRWSKEFGEAKDATIKSKQSEIDSLKAGRDEILKVKDAHISELMDRIQSLKDLAPTNLRDCVVATRELLEENNNALVKSLEDAKNTIGTLQKEIEEKDALHEKNKGRVELLAKEKKEKEKAIQQLEGQLIRSRSALEYIRQVDTSQFLYPFRIRSIADGALKPPETPPVFPSSIKPIVSSPRPMMPSLFTPKEEK